MKASTALCTSALVGTGTVLGLLWMAVIQWPSGVIETQARAEEKPTGAPEATNAPPVPNTNNALLPDQSHAMTDVGYHFANLWFAGDKENSGDSIPPKLGSPSAPGANDLDRGRSGPQRHFAGDRQLVLY